MKPPIFAILALCLLGVPAQAQLQLPNRPAAATVDLLATDANLAGPHVNRTNNGDADHPVAHVYQRGEHLSLAYGEFAVVSDWSRYGLAPPPAGHHWVQYGKNYLLVQSDSGLITDIVAQT